MRKFFGSNKAFLAIIVGALIVGGAIYFGNSRNVPSSVAPTDLSEAKCLAPSQVLVTKVIDGDTIVVEGGYHIRLLGIDTDEKGYPCYEAAKSRLEELVLNKKVKLEKGDDIVILSIDVDAAYGYETENDVREAFGEYIKE